MEIYRLKEEGDEVDSLRNLISHTYSQLSKAKEMKRRKTLVFIEKLNLFTNLVSTHTQDHSFMFLKCSRLNFPQHFRSKFHFHYLPFLNVSHYISTSHSTPTPFTHSHSFVIPVFIFRFIQSGTCS